MNSTERIKSIFRDRIKTVNDDEIIEQLPLMDWKKANETARKYNGKNLISNLPEGFRISQTIPVEKFSELFEEALVLQDEKSILEKMLEIDKRDKRGHTWFILMIMDEKHYLPESEKL